MTNLIFDAARRYVDAGLSVIPLRWGSKEPDLQALALTTGVSMQSQDKRMWLPYTTEVPTNAEIRAWFDNERPHGLGTLGRGLVRLDFEHPLCLTVWESLVDHHIRRLTETGQGLAIVQTRKGHHVYFWMPDPPGYEVLCSKGTGDTRIVLSEVQGAGCYCVAPPSEYWREDGQRDQYRWIRGNETEIPRVDQDTGIAWIVAARFPGFWEYTNHQVTLEVQRSGILLTNRMYGQHPMMLYWSALATLREHSDIYRMLLDAVENAPPPPPSYDIWSEPEYDDE